MKLTPLQQRVASQYEGGEFGYVTDTDELGDLGDTLFVFLVMEAGDAGGCPEKYDRMLEAAIRQLRSLQYELEETPKPF